MLRSHQVRTSTAIRTVRHPAEAHDVHDAGGGARAHAHVRAQRRANVCCYSRRRRTRSMSHARTARSLRGAAGPPSTRR